MKIKLNETNPDGWTFMIKHDTKYYHAYLWAPDEEYTPYYESPESVREWILPLWEKATDRGESCLVDSIGYIW